MNVKELEPSTPSQQVNIPANAKYILLQKLEFIIDYCLRGAMVFTGLG